MSMRGQPILERTPLLVAASFPGTVEILQLLVSKGADIHAKDKSGMHALGRAATYSDVDVVRFLVEHGCDPNEPGYGGARLRVYARHYQPNIEYLMSKGLKIPAEALPGASHWEPPELIERWIALGADVNGKQPPYQRTSFDDGGGFGAIDAGDAEAAAGKRRGPECGGYRG